MNEPKTLWANSLVSLTDGKPRVDITVPGGRAQMSYEEAVRFATQILECAEAAMVDAFVFHWLTTKLNTQPEIAIQIMKEFREFRDLISRDEELRK